jgi:EAL domain-containing protein (putative c-di-GMP-specific phosphodiesterase class I)
MAFAKLSVMVVEDHGFQRRMALRLLAELGVTRVHEAEDGNSALEVLRALPQVPDIVLVDLDLPGMDGIELIGHMAEAKLARAVVVASALDPALMNTVQTMARAYGLRVLANVEKPLTSAKLSEVMSSFEAQEDDIDDDVKIEIDRPAIQDALARSAFIPYFQPQVTLSNGHAVAVEALARWRLDDGQIVRPTQFIPAVEREGLIDQLTEQILDSACAYKSKWRQAGLHMRVAVNVSMLNLVDVKVIDRFLEIVRRHEVEPREVVLEITESSVMGEAAHALHVLARLRLKGFGLSIDDFGTGYSSLSQLSQIPFTELKIDQSFVSGAARQPRKRAVVEASLGLARKLNLGVVAEGVENVEEWQMLADLGCTFAQGYLISRPVQGDELPDVVAHWRRPRA